MTVQRKNGRGSINRQGRIAKRALARAVNRATTGARAEAAREVARETGLKVRDVRQASTLKRARAADIEARVEVRGKPLNLIRFRARQVKGGVRAKAYGRSRLYRGMWIGNNGRTVFVRTRRGGRKVRGAFGPGIAKTFLMRVRTRTFRKEYGERVNREFRTSYAYLLDRAGVNRG